jgi:hypothetical protein
MRRERPSGFISTAIDQRDLLGRKGPDRRREFFYWTDDGNLAGLRYDDWKAVFMEQQAHRFDVWAQPMVQLRLPMLFNLRSDPFERAQHEAGDYVRWFVDHALVIVPAQGIVAQHLASFQSRCLAAAPRAPLPRLPLVPAWWLAGGVASSREAGDRAG